MFDSILVVGDLHLSPHPRAQYRWELFDWMTKACLRRGVTDVVQLGDLTDAKDLHPSQFVNRLIETLRHFVDDAEVRLHVLRGNHDGLIPTEPFFRFLGSFPEISFYTYPEWAHEHVLMLPHSRSPEMDWQKLDFGRCRLAFMHQTVVGARTENGTVMTEGLTADFFKPWATTMRVLSGDIHVPQQVGQVLYLGSPYPIRFGDDHLTRIIWLPKGVNGPWHQEELTFPSMAKHTLVGTEAEVREQLQTTVLPHDQVRITLTDLPTDPAIWTRVREAVRSLAAARGIDLVSVTVTSPSGGKTTKNGSALHTTDPMAVLAQWGQDRHVDQTVLAVGRKILAEAMKP